MVCKLSKEEIQANQNNKGCAGCLITLMVSIAIMLTIVFYHYMLQSDYNRVFEACLKNKDIQTIINDYSKYCRKVYKPGEFIPSSSFTKYHNHEEKFKELDRITRNAYDQLCDGRISSVRYREILSECYCEEQLLLTTHNTTITHHTPSYYTLSTCGKPPNEYLKQESFINRQLLRLIRKITRDELDCADPQDVVDETYHRIVDYMKKLVRKEGNVEW